jgi:glycosyltransferase involved in cell wall biosynthesis
VSAKLTALIPCKDERRNIRPCIESVRDVADEILIADSGSTDGTLDIVRRIGGCRIIEREYVNSANFKNWAIPQARHEWVLLVDADERVTPELAEEVRRVLESPPEDKDGFWIGRLNHYLGYPIKHCGWNTDDVIRLFRRDKGVYQNTTWDSDQFLYKLNRYAGWGALNLRDQRRGPSTLAMFTRAPLRFLQLYFLRLGFLDGIPGFQVCMYTAFYSYLKQAKLWEMRYALPQPDPEATLAGNDADDQFLSFPPDAARDESVAANQERRAA